MRRALLAALVVGLISAGGSSASAASESHALAKRVQARIVTKPRLVAPALVGEQPRFFSPSSFWNQRLIAREPLAPDAARDGAKLARQARYTTTSSPIRGNWAPGYGAIINHSDYSVPVYTVGPDVPRTRVTLVKYDNKTPITWDKTLQPRLESVPVPSDVAALASAGTDHHLVIHQPSSDSMWEFWGFTQSGTGPTATYRAQWGAKIASVSASSGVLPLRWGARASSLALVGGLVTMQDFLRGSIPHALAVSAPVLDSRAAAPATRTDGPAAWIPGGETQDAVSEGARFRLPADTSCGEARPGDAATLQAMLCAAARDYGIVVVDRSKGVNIYAEDARSVGTNYQSIRVNPWVNVASKYFWGPSNVLNTFPWERLVRLADCRTPGCLPDQPPVTDPAGAGTYEGDSAAVSYVGGWRFDYDSSASGGSIHYTAEGGAAAQLTFSGSNISWSTRRWPWSGIANVYLDGRLVSVVDCYAGQTRDRQVVYSASFPERGVHTIRIERSGRKNAASSGTSLILDALHVT